MKLRITLLVLFLCLLPGAAHGQCIVQASAYYTTSNSEAMTNNGNNTYDIIETVIVEGSTDMQMIADPNGRYGCQQSQIDAFNAAKPYIQHVPKATDQINGNGGTTQGPTFCAECYSSYQVSTDSGSLQPGQIVYASIGGEVDCPSVGQIFSAVWPTLELEVAYTRAKGIGTYSGCTGVASVVCDYDTFSDCTPQTSPPDMPIGKVRVSFPQAPPLIWECYGLGFRWYPYQTNWIFTNATILAIKSGLDVTAACTKNP